MSGETNLDRLLRGMSAELVDGVYVFATVAQGDVPKGLTPRMMFHEAEGVTLVLLQDEAQAAGLAFDFPCRMITLNVHSALEAVGFIARIATVLAGAGMGVNPVAGFYHDHLFIPENHAEDAMHLLAQLAKGALD
ncbi:MAG: ACT domain-containing protein [Rhodobacteraceae bacterium]|nr:ACT domain-containing protein [Paracoccaceae bacterium]